MPYQNKSFIVWVSKNLHAASPLGQIPRGIDADQFFGSVFFSVNTSIN